MNAYVMDALELVHLAARRSGGISQVVSSGFRRSGVRIERVFPSATEAGASAADSASTGLPQGEVTLGQAFQAIRELPGASATIRVGTVRSAPTPRL